MKHEPIARLLVERKILPESAVKKAAAEARSVGSFLGGLLELGVPEPDLVGVVADHLGIPGVDLSRTAIDLAVLDIIPRIVAEADLVLPLSSEGGRLHIALSAAEEHHDVIEELRFATGLEISAYAALPGPLENAIAAAYDAKDRGDPVWRGEGLLPDSKPGAAVVLKPAGKPAVIEDVVVEIGGDDAEAEILESVEVRTGPARILVVDDDA